MVAIVTGNGLGLQSSSALGLGGRGQVGSAGFGKNGEQIYVNAATGNLVLHDRDQWLMGRGVDAEMYRAYNSQAQLPGEAWRPGVRKQIDGLTGTVGTAGSSVYRTDWDGSRIAYTWDAARSLYVASSGAGTRDTLSWNAQAQRWTWTQGGGQVSERYDASLGGRLTQALDRDGNITEYVYTAAGALSEIRTANNESTFLDYDASNRLIAIRTVTNGAGRETRTTARYGYDSLDRLTSVTIDLTPDDSSIVDGKVFTTTYGYDGNSTRIAWIEQTDGSRVAFTYQQIGGEYRVATISQTSDAGVVRVTRLSYDLASRRTVITDPLGLDTVLTYDAQGRLLETSTPIVDGGRQTQIFSYNDAGQVATVRDGVGNLVSYTYDTKGNLIRQEDSAGTVVERRYGENDELLSETVSASGTTAATTHYVYDAERHLRFVVSAEDRIDEYRYDSYGNRTDIFSYTVGRYSGADKTEAALAAWVAANGRVAERTYLYYDYRGNLQGETKYNALRGDGGWVDDNKSASTVYVYDAQGRLLSRTVMLDGGTSDSEVFTYDGLGRLLTATALNDAVTTYQYDDSQRRTTVKLDNGLIRTSVHNQAGELIAVSESGNGTELSHTLYAYDSDGRLRMTEDSSGAKTHRIYDAAGRLSAQIDATGALTEYRYNRNGQLTQTLRYATLVAASALAGLIDSNGRPRETVEVSGQSVALTLDNAGIRPLADAADRREWNVYDAAGRIARSIDANGMVTSFEYDAASHLIRTVAHDTPVPVETLTSNPTLAQATPTASDGDRVTRYFYDADGLLRATLNAFWALEEIVYDDAGRKVQTIVYASSVGLDFLATGTLDQLRPKRSEQDINRYFFYNPRGQLATEVDGEGYVTRYEYDRAGNLARRTRGTKVAPSSLMLPQTITGSFRATATAGSDGIWPQVEVWLDGVKLQTITLNASGGPYEFSAQVVPGINHQVSLVYTNAGSGRQWQIQQFAFGDTPNAAAAVWDLGGTGTSVGSVQPSPFTQLTENGALRWVADSNRTIAWLSSQPGELEVSEYQYDSTGRLMKQTEYSASGNVTTQFAYDKQDHVTGLNRAGRKQLNRYDIQGRLIAQLSGEGAKALEALGATPTEAQVEAVWNTWAVRHQYDAEGLLSSTTDALGRRTLFYYDNTGRLIYTINPLGETVEQRYNAFGDISQTITYALRLTSASLGQMRGGRADQVARAAIAALDNSDASRVTLQYNVTGTVDRLTDAIGALTQYQYTRFNERYLLTRWTSLTDHSAQTAIATDYSYDNLGRVIGEMLDPNGLRITSSVGRDLRGFISYERERNSLKHHITRDRNGLVKSLHGPNQEYTRTTYDAFGNVLSHTDRTGNTTAYQYTAFNREVSTTTAEGIKTVMRYNEHGQVVELMDGTGAKTVYEYDLDGRLIKTTAPAGSSRTVYDRAGQVIETIDANGTRTVYEYDAAGRVLTRTLDPDGLKIKTQYEYDAKGQQVRFTDPKGTVTQTRYDLSGQKIEVVVDAGAGRANLTTTYEYDALGQLLKVTEGVGTAARRVTAHTYDKGGRVIATVQDPGGLNLTTSFAYDTYGNLLARIAANGSVTRYVYDNRNRLVRTIDATGAVERRDYDQEGRLLSTTVYARRIDLIGLANTVDVEKVDGRLSVQATQDRTTRFVYDRDGRLRYSVDTFGLVTESVYNGANQVARALAYATPIAADVAMSVTAIQAALAAQDSSAHAADRASQTVFDAAGRAVFQLDALRSVTRNVYDANGNVTARVRYAATYPAGRAVDQTALAAWADAQPAEGQIVLRWFYDRANRPLFSIDASGQVSETVYDALGQVVRTVAYATPLTGVIPQTESEVRAALAAQSAAAHEGDRVVHSVYDALGRIVFRVDTLNNVVEYAYDAVGQVVRTIAYATPISGTVAKALADIRAALDAQNTTAHANDRLARVVYDAVGRTEFQIDAAGYVIRNRFDTAGNLIGRIRYTAAYNAPGALDRAALLAWTATQGAAVKVEEQWIYDRAGHLLWQVDADGYVTQHRYDSSGNPIRSVRFATSVRQTAPSDYTDAAMTAWVSTIPGAGSRDAAAVTLRFYDRAGRETYVFDAMGHFTERVYDAFGQVSKSIRYDGQWPAQFGSAPVNETDSLASIQARLSGAAGAVTQQVFDKAGRLIDRIDALGITTHYERDGLGQVIAEYAAWGTADQIATRRRYDASGRLIEETRAAGTLIAASTRYTYDAFGQVVSVTEPRGVELAESDTEWALAQRRELGFLNNADTVLLASELTDSQRAELLRRYSSRTVYDSAGRVLQSIDATGGTVTRTYNAFGDAVRVVDALGNTGYFYFDALGRVTQQVDPERFLTATVYDFLGNAVKVQRYATRVTGTGPLDLSTPPATPAGAVSETVMEYDLLGHLVRTTDAENHTERFTYDAFGQKTQYVNKLGGYVTYRYDLLGRLTEEEYGSLLVWLANNTAGSLTHRYAYDARGNLVRQTEAVGTREERATVFTYDALDRRLSASTTVATEGSAVVAALETYGYDRRGNLIESIDANRQRTAYYYDAANRRSGQVDPTGLLTLTDYDLAGNVTRTRAYTQAVTLPAGATVPTPPVSSYRETRYLYDANQRRIQSQVLGVAVGRVTREQGPNGVPVETYRYSLNTTITQKWLYNAAGQVIQYTDGNGGVTRTYYDALGAKAFEIDAENYGVAWKRDAEGNVLEERRYAQKRPDALSVNSTAAALMAGWPLSSDDRITAYSYDKMGRRLSESRLNVAYSRVDDQGRLVDAAGRLIDINGRLLDANGKPIDGTSTVSAATTTYAYDAAGNLVRRTDAVGNNYWWEYDKAGRNTLQARPVMTDYTGKVVFARTEFAYNGLNQIIQETRRGSTTAEDQITAYGYGAGGRMLSRTNALGHTTWFGYDAVGNTTAMSYLRKDSSGTQRTEVITVTYDAVNRETQRVTRDSTGQRSVERRTEYNLFGEVTGRGIGPTGWQEYSEYDLAGRMIKSNAQGGATKVYVYDGNGNATMLLESQTDELRPLAYNDIVRRNDVYQTITEYDGRNQSVSVKQPSMNAPGDRIGLPVREVPGTTVPGQVQVVVGGPSGTDRGPIHGPADGALSLPPNASSLGQVTAKGFFQGVGGWGSTPPSQYVVNVNVPDLSALYGSYSIRVVVTGNTSSTPQERVATNPPHSFTDIPVYIGGTWRPAGTDSYVTVVGLNYTVKVYVTPRSTGREELVSTGTSATTTGTFTYRAGSGGFVGGAPGDASFGFSLNNKAIRLPQDSYRTDIATQVYVRGWGSTGAYVGLPVNRDQASGYATADISGLAAGQYEVLYLAEDKDGTLYRRELYQMQVGSDQWIRGSSPQFPGGFQFNTTGTFVTTASYTLLANLRTRKGVVPSGVTVQYRAYGSNDALTDHTMLGAISGISTTASDVVWQTAGLTGHYEVLVHLWNGTGQILDTIWVNADLGPSAMFLPMYGNSDNSIRLTGLPPNADEIDVVLTWPTGDTRVLASQALSTPGSFQVEVPPDLIGSTGTPTYTLTLTLRDKGTVPPTVYTISGPIEIGPQRNPYKVLNPTAPIYSLTLSPNEPDGQVAVLNYRPEGAQSSEFQQVMLLKGPDGKYRWDSLGLDPNKNYEYFYYVYRSLDDARSTDTSRSLRRVNGRFQPTASAPAREAYWEIALPEGSDRIIQRKQSYNAFGEVVSETDGRNNTTRLYYNTLGKLVQKSDPWVRITRQNGFQEWTNPLTQYIYDLAGQLVGYRDANGNLTTQAWNYGTAEPSVAAEWHADGGVKRYGVDVLGNQRVVIDELNRRTDYTYDAGNRLIRIDRPQRSDGRAWDTYTYDELDRRISHTGVLGRDTTDFSIEGEVNRTVSAEGRITQYSAVWTNQGTADGSYVWKRTTTNANNQTMTDIVNGQGKTIQRTDFGGHLIQYRYNAAGLLIQQGATTYEYYANGLLKRTHDAVQGTKAYYEYDANGNRTFEGFTGKNGQWAFQQSTATYDALNRLVAVNDPRYDITYEYDANGNRIHMASVYKDGLNGQLQTQDYWYQYDAMNRFTVTMGQLRDGRRGTSATDGSAYVYAAGPDGVALSYDYAGQRLSATYASDNHVEGYVYDTLGYLQDTTINGIHRARRYNDLAGRVTQYEEYDTAGKTVTSLTRTWDKDSQLSKEKDNLTGKVTTMTRMADGTLSQTKTQTDGDQTVVTTYYNYAWFDTAKQTEVTVQPYNPHAPNWAAGLSKYVYDDYGRLLIAFDQNGHRGFSYQTDGEGRILQRDELVGGQVDANGRVTNATANRHHSYYFFDDRQVGNVGNDGIERIDYARQLAEQQAAAGAKNDDRHKRFQPVAGADFDQNYEPINSQYPGAAPGSYVVRAGDTLQGIALALWGDSAMWYLLADANGLGANEPLTPNSVLTVPNKVTNIHNNAGTFKPYNAGEATGNTSPTVPEPPPPPSPKKAGCGGFVKVLAVVVMVVATVFTAGVATVGFSGGFGAIMGAGIGASAGALAVGAAVGSVLSQGVLIAGGVQDKFSWKQVALAAIGGAVTAGISGWSPIANMTSELGKAVVSGVVGNIANQGVSILAGEQSGFDWKGVAISAVASGVAYGVNQGIGRAQYGEAEWAKVLKNGVPKGDWSKTAIRSFASSGAAGVVNAVARGNVSGNVLTQVGLNVLGSTIGNAIADAAVDRAGRVAATSDAGGAKAQRSADPFNPVIASDALVEEGSWNSLGAFSLGSGLNSFGQAGGAGASQGTAGGSTNGYGAGGAGQSDKAAAGGKGYYVPTEQELDIWLPGGIEQFQALKANTKRYYASNASSLPPLPMDNEGPMAWLDYNHRLQDILYQASRLSGDSFMEMAANGPTNADTLRVSDEAVDREIRAGKTSAADAAWYAARYTAYEVWNFATLGFVKRHDERLTAHAEGRLSSQNFWTATAVDGVGSVASLYAGGRAGSFVLGRMGSGVSGYAFSGAAGGAAGDVVLQASGMANYAITGGQTGQQSFSAKELLIATGAGALLGGGLRYAESFPALNVPYTLRSPIVFPRTPSGQLNSGIPVDVQNPLVKLDLEAIAASKYPGATRRVATPGDQQFPTADDALAEALARHGIDPSTVEITTMYGKNGNLTGEKGEPWELISGLTEDARLIEFQHHPNGHFFKDTNQFEIPHYHGPNNAHLTYLQRHE